MAENNATPAKRLSPEELRQRTDPKSFAFDTTGSVEPLRGSIGQQRALEAIQTGLGMSPPGFNVFAAGAVGTGRNSTVRALVEAKARNEPTPNDWCYVHNFEKPNCPRALELPPGEARQLADDMGEFVGDCEREIPKTFEGEEYEKRKNEAMQDLEKQKSHILATVQEKAQELEHAVQVSPAGIVAVPLKDGEPLSSEDFEQLDDEKKEDLREKGQRVREIVNEAVSKVRSLEKQAKEKSVELDKEIAMFAIGHLIKELRDKYGGNDAVAGFLDKVQQDIIDNIQLVKDAGKQPEGPLDLRAMAPSPYEKYRVNVLVDHGKTEGAPVIDERNPTYYRLFGRLEYRFQLGGMVTDFTMVRSGAVQRASGGYLILQILDVLLKPLAWEGLKRALRTGKLGIENMWDQYQAVPATTLHPQSIPINVKVVLVGSRLLYDLLYAFDDDFRRLFKIKADFDVEMDRSDDHLKDYAAFVSARCDEYGLPPFEGGAVARLADFGARLSEHRDKMSTRFMDIADVVSEAGYLARRNNAAAVSADHVDRALDTRERRARLVQDKIQELIDEDQLLVDTDKAVVGQANGLSVYEFGGHRFSKPSRITCITSVGRAGVVNIERETKMSGSIHDKGVLILNGCLADRFGQDKPLSLSASLCFEQSYGPVDGDSASCAELYALLSSLAGIPLRQDIAVTGSVNQRGQVQPIGGANEKIEGFFEVCKQRGLTGRQGVLIPARNTRNLMLKQEVIDAVRDEQFHVYAVSSIEQGVEVLLGAPAGERDDNGRYLEGSVFAAVDKRLRDIADTLKAFVPVFESQPMKPEDEDYKK